MPEYALVYFLGDKEKYITTTDNIKEFDRSKVGKSVPFNVYWDGGEDVVGHGVYKALVLLLGNTREELEKYMQAKRIKIPNIKGLSDQDDSDDDLSLKGIQNEIKESKCEEKVKNAKKVQSKVMAFKKIINDKSRIKKTNPEFKSFDNATNYKALFTTTKAENAKLKEDILKFKEENVKLKKKLEDKQMEQTLMKTYQSLNCRLQKQLLEIMENNKGSGDDATPTKLKFSKFGKTSSSSHINEIDLASSSIGNLSSIKKFILSPEKEWQMQVKEPRAKHENHEFLTSENDMQIMESTECSKNKIIKNAEKEDYLTEQQMQYINQYKPDSQFVKALAVGVWGSLALSTASTTGIKSNRNPNCQAWRALTPKKLQYVKDKFRERMIKENCTQNEIDVRMKNVNRYITEKICDIRRRGKLTAAVKEP